MKEERYDDESKENRDQLHQQKKPAFNFEELDRQLEEIEKKELSFKTDNHPHDKGNLKYNF